MGVKDNWFDPLGSYPREWGSTPHTPTMPAPVDYGPETTNFGGEVRFFPRAPWECYDSGRIAQTFNLDHYDTEGSNPSAPTKEKL